MCLNIFIITASYFPLGNHFFSRKPLFGFLRFITLTARTLATPLLHRHHHHHHHHDNLLWRHSINRCSAASYNGTTIHYLYNVAYRCRKQVSFQLATESIMRISVPDASRKWVPFSRTCNSKWAVSKACLCSSACKITTCWWAEAAIAAATTYRSG